MRRLIACVIIGLGLLIALNHCRKKENRSILQQTKKTVADCSSRWIDSKVIFFPLPALLMTCREKMKR
jgi:hypothetical protein